MKTKELSPTAGIWLFLNLALFILVPYVGHSQMSSYCNSSANYVGYEEIIEVAFASFVNSSAPASGQNYSDFTSIISATLSPGMTYPISITSGIPSGYSGNYSCFVKVYIDWNQDTVWSETSDELVFSAPTNSANTVSGEFTVPFNALPGSVAMRVVFQETVDATTVLSCGFYSWGETEDYLLTVAPPQPIDAGIIEVMMVGGSLPIHEHDTVEVKVVMLNFGLDSISSAELVYTFDGLNPIAYTWTGLLASFERDTIVFSGIVLPGGLFELCAYTILPGDSNLLNDANCRPYYAIPDFDLELTSLVAPIGGCDQALVDVTVEISNLGNAVNGGYDISYFHYGMTNSLSETISDTIPQGGVYIHTFSTPLDLTVSSDTSFELHTYLSYLPDPVLSNDTLITIIESKLSPTNPSVLGATVWSGEYASLSINNPEPASFYNWYDHDTILLANGSVFTTPALFDTTSYFVEANYGLAPATLSTPMNSNMGQAGNMFDVTALSGMITLDSFNVNFDNVATIDIYYKAGTYQGFETNAAAWTLLGSVPNLVSNGANIPTPVAIGGLNIPMGEKYGIWITTSNGSINYTMLTSQPNWSDGNLHIDHCSGVSYPLGSVYTPRGWCGTIYYSGDNGCPSELVPVAVDVQFADIDGAVQQILNPDNTLFVTNQDVSCIIYNNGLQALSGFSLHYQLNGNPAITESFMDSIQPGASYTYTFSTPLTNLGYGYHTICVGLDIFNDALSSNDSICNNFTIWSPPLGLCETAFPYGNINDAPIISELSYAYDQEWWKFEVPSPHNNVVVSLCGSGFDTELQIWDSCNAAFVSQYNDDYCGAQSQITVPGIVEAGTYYVRVNGGGSSFGSFQLTITGDYVPKFEIIETIVEPSCNGDVNGIISITIGAGQSGTTAAEPLSYLWYDANNNIISTLDSLVGVLAGIYTVEVSDSTGWTETKSITLTEPAELEITGLLMNQTVFGGNTGSIEISATGGTLPYSYYWSTGETGASIQSCAEGLYIVTVTDSRGCVVDSGVSVTSMLPSVYANIHITNTVHAIQVPANAAVTIDGNAVSPGSLLAVFYDSLGADVCGGYTYYTPGLETTLQAYGADPGFVNGFAQGETFTWRLWDAGEEYDYPAEANFIATLYPNQADFAAGGQSGISALIVNTIVTQQIVLPAGWSIWSTYIEPLDTDIAIIMAELIAPPFVQGDVEIVVNGSGVVFWPFYGVSQQGFFNTGEGYRVKINGTSPVTFGVTGHQLRPELTLINIPGGWSILAYLRTTPTDISILLAPLLTPAVAADKLLIAKNGEGQVYWPLYGVNTIGNMLSGEGYQLKMSSSHTNFVYPAN